MQVLPIMGQLHQDKTNFSGEVIVKKPYKKGEKTKYESKTIELSANLSEFLKNHIKYNLRKYENWYMHDDVYEGIMKILENSPEVQKQKAEKNIELPHAYRPQYLSYNVPIDYLVYPEYSSPMVQFFKWYDRESLHLKIGNALEIIV